MIENSLTLDQLAASHHEPRLLRAAIFDLDGTLLDTLEDLADSANEALANAGFPTHPVDAYRTFVGDGVAALIGRILPASHRDEATAAHVIAHYRHVYGRRWNKKSRPYPGVVTALETLHTRGVRMAVLSNKPQDFTVLCIDHLLPGHSFSMVLGQRDHVPRKPDPAGALEIAAAWGLDPGEIAFIGDTRTDMETARRAGMVPVGVTWGFRPVDELRASGAIHLADCAGRLPDLFAGVEQACTGV